VVQGEPVWKPGRGSASLGKGAAERSWAGRRGCGGRTCPAVVELCGQRRAGRVRYCAGDQEALAQLDKKVLDCQDVVGHQL